MDKDEFDAIVARLNDVSGVISQLDPAVRAEAFTLLKPYVVGGDSPAGSVPEDTPLHANRGKALKQDAIDALLDEHASDTPVENGLLIAAILYAKHGKGPFAVKEFTALADEYSLAMPGQFHKSLGPVRRDDADIFRKVKNGWQITIAGEKWLKATYGVSQGSEPHLEGDK